MPDAVARARVWEVALPLRVPFAISGGTMAVRRSLIVELEDGTGLRGYGEAAPFERPFYSGETVASAAACLTDVLLPRMVSSPVGGPADLRSLLAEGVRGNRMARAGADTAWWDLQARRSGRALADLVASRLDELGVPPALRARRGEVECGVALGIPEKRHAEVLDAEVRDAVAAGYRRVKLKVSPGWTAEPVAAARRAMAAMGANLPLWVDANGAFDRARHEDELDALDRLGLSLVEQPFAPEALWDAVEWNRRATTPVCLDESLTSDAVARQVVAMGGPTIWNLKVQRLGGLEETCLVYARGAAAGAAMWVGTMPETGIGAQAALAIGAFAGCVHPTDVEPSARWYEAGADPVELTMDAGGRMAVPSAPPPIDLDGARLFAEVS